MKPLVLGGSYRSGCHRPCGCRCRSGQQRSLGLHAQDYSQSRHVIAQPARLGTSICRLALDPKLLAATALLLVVPTFHTAIPPWLSERRRLWAVVVPVVSIAALVAPVVVLWSIQQLLPPGRTLSAIYMIFLIAWFASTYVLLAGLRSAASDSPAAVRLTFTIYLAGALCWSHNFCAAVRDLNGAARAYHAAARERHASIRAAVAAGKRNIRVAPYPVIPASLNFMPDLVEHGSTRPDAFVNIHAALYFGVDTIALAQPLAVATTGPKDTP